MGAGEEYYKVPESNAREIWLGTRAHWQCGRGLLRQPRRELFRNLRVSFGQSKAPFAFSLLLGLSASLFTTTSPWWRASSPAAAAPWEDRGPIKM